MRHLLDSRFERLHIFNLGHEMGKKLTMHVAAGGARVNQQNRGVREAGTHGTRLVR